MDFLQRKRRQSNGLFLISFLAVVLYAPVILIRAGVIPFKYRFVIMFCLLAVMIFYVWLRKFCWFDLGFRRDTLKQSLIWNLGLSLFFLTILYCLHNMEIVGKMPIRFWPVFFVFYILILVPAQEFFFRSLLFAELGNLRYKRHWSIIIISSLSFCFLHIIYKHPLMLLTTFFMGLIWSIIYYKYPNFWGVSLSHALLGVVAFALGLI